MNEKDFESLLIDVFDEFSCLIHESFIELYNNEAITFEEAHLLTRDSGIVITLKDGEKFNLIIQKSY